MSLIKKISRFFKIKKQDPVQEKEVKSSVRTYVGKFVKQNGNDIGESIAIEKTRFIIKNPDGFMSVPFEAVVKNAENIEVGDFNREESLELGKDWFERKDVLKFDEKGMMILGDREPQ